MKTTEARSKLKAVTLAACLAIGCAAAVRSYGALPQIVSASDSHVTVMTDAVGVESIVLVGKEFHIITTNVSDSFVCEVGILANSPWRLESPQDGLETISFTHPGFFHVKSTISEEDEYTGKIVLFKVDVTIDGVDESKEEVDGAFVAVDVSNEGIGTSNVSYRLAPVKIRCLPQWRPDSEKIKIAFADGTLFEKIGERYVSATNVYPAAGVGARKFYVYRRAASGSVLDSEIRAWHLQNNCSDKAKYTAVSIELGEYPRCLFRGTTNYVSLTVKPAELLGDANPAAGDAGVRQNQNQILQQPSRLNVSLSGFDDEHITAEYISGHKKIAIGSLITESAPFAWIDRSALKIAARLDNYIDTLYEWEEEHENKKTIEGIWNNIVEDFESSIDEAASPAGLARRFVYLTLSRHTAIDSIGAIHSIPSQVIDSAAWSMYNEVSTIWAESMNSFYGIPIEELKDKHVLESWKWNWDLDLEVELVGGTISLDPQISHLVSWIDSISDDGFDRSIFVMRSVTVGPKVNANGRVADAQFSIEISGLVRYVNDMIIDIETGETAAGHIDFGIGVVLYARF